MDPVKSEDGVTPEDILVQTGGCGRFQVVVSVIIQMTKTVVAWSLSGMVFIAYAPNWRCLDDAINDPHSKISAVVNGSNTTFSSAYYVAFNANTTNVSVKSVTYWNKQCKSASGESCRNFEFEPGIRTIASEFDLVCDKAWVTATTMSIQMAAMCVGSLLAGQTADLLGRKKPFFFAITMLFASHLLAYFSTSWVMFAVARFFVGIGSSFYLTLEYNILSEFCLSRWRTVVIGFPTWNFAVCIFALVAWLLEDWRYVSLITSLIAFAFLFSWCIIPEGFRWLIAKDRHAEAHLIVKRIAVWNKHPVPDFERMHKLLPVQVDHSTSRKYTVLDLFRRRELLKLLLPLMVSWLNLGLSSYGISFGIQKLSGDIYMNIFLFSITSLPPRAFGIFIQNRFGRKAASILAFGLCGSGALVVGLVQIIDTPHRDSLTNGFALVANIGITMGWGPTQTITVEVFPTVVRAISFGFLSTLGRMGAVIGPQLVFFNELVPGLMYFVVAAVSTMAALGTLCLPETLDATLRDKLQGET